MTDNKKPPDDETGLPGKIGPFRILDILGEGGMAVVYLAEQYTPVKRRVALKILKPGMDTRQVIARFESERQALAVLDHPNIAKVFDGGVTELGRPYFVMERVHGIPITDYCDDNRLSTEKRVDLFTEVCSAVQHAHHKGLIHRDLKPSNLLVGVVDGHPQVKVIDFGIAKATTATLVDKTLVTRIGQIIGTPQYMSPEQADSSGIDVDTRTDIYSLGVVFYELLVGIVPLNLAAIGDHAMRLALREKDPSKPSTRISELGDTQNDIARTRRTDPNSDPSSIGQGLNNLGFVQNRLSRYQDAAGSFEEAVSVLANTDSRGLYSRALANLAATYMSSGRLSESRELQEEALSIKRDWFGPDHIETAYSLANISFLYQYFGEFEKSAAFKRESIDIFSKQLGENHPNIAIILGGLAWNLSLQGQYAEAEATLFDALDRIRNSFGPDSMSEPSMLNTLGEMYAAQGRFEEAETQFRNAMRITALTTAEHAEMGRALGGLANLAESTLSVEERERYFDDSLNTLGNTTGLGTPEAALIQMNFGAYLSGQGEDLRGRELFQAGLNHLADALPTDHSRYKEQAARYESLFGESYTPADNN